MKKFKSLFIFALIIILAFILRFYSLDKIPASLTPDELALGYTSFSILNTGADIHGNFLPISFNVFGTAWTLIGYPIIEIISLLIFGLNDFAIRAPSALAGVFGVVLIYFIAGTLFKKNPTLNLFAALIYAVSPWNVYFSRLGLEYNLALSVFLLGLLLFLRYIYVDDKKDNLLIFSIIFFSITEYIYYPYAIFIPIFLIALFFLFRKIIIKNKKRIWVFSIFILSNLFIYFVISQTSIQEISSQSIFNDKAVIYDRVEKFRTDNSNERNLLQKILHNKYLGVNYQVAQNYLNTFSSSFLFDKGGDKIERDIGYFGKLYLIDALFLIVGFTALIYRKDKNILFFCVWLVIAPIASSITKGAPSSSRLFMLMPLFTLVSAYGIYQLWVILRNNLIKKALLTLIMGLFLLNIIFFLDAYYVHFNYQRVRFMHYGYKQVVELTQKYPDYNVVFEGPDNFPYIYFIFYNKYDPKKFINQVIYYSPTSEGFTFVKSFGRYSFPLIIDYRNLKPRTIYIYNTNVENRKNKILLPSGEPILGYEIIN